MSEMRASEQAIRESVRAAVGTIEPLDLERAGRELAERAEREGLLDCAYTTIDSPLGPLLAAATERGLVSLGFPNEPAAARLERLAAAVGPRLLELPGRFDEVRRQLDEYFEGGRSSFELALDWRLTRGFVRRVLDVTARIPYGEVRSYAEVAAAAGSPRAFRAAGSALGANPIPIIVPCHRVLRSGGALGGYGGGLDVKRRLLELEGAQPSPPEPAAGAASP